MAVTSSPVASSAPTAGTTPIAPAALPTVKVRWPIAVRLGVVLALAALLPMLAIGYINLHGSIEKVREAESKTLQQLAVTTAGRLDQFIRDTRHLLQYFAWSREAIGIVDRGEPTTAQRTAITEIMDRLLAANNEIELLMVLDRQGKVRASSKPDYVGRDLSFRDYFKTASQGVEYISPLEIGTSSGKPGLYFGTPVRAPTGLVAGVAVMKMRGEAVTGIVDAAASAERVPFLIDGDNIVIDHPEPAMMYKSLRPLEAAQLKRIADERRFGDAQVSPIDLPELEVALRYLPTPTAVGYERDGQRRIAGLAPMATHNLTVAIEESHATFSRPLETLYANLGWSALGIGIAAIVFAALFARTFVGPIRRLAAGAMAVHEGRYADAPVAPKGNDELAALTRTFNEMVSGVVARERERDIFGRVVSPDVREKLLAGELTLGGENRRVTVLFSDIRGFSTLSEQMSPQDVVSFLNDYLTEMADAVKPWGGYINNFIGDAIVVVFGAPQALPDIEWRAVAAALDMKARLEGLNRKRAALGDAPLATGIGISTGKVVAGQVGSLERFLYTVIGDAVNVAARLEAMTKDVEGNPVLVNAATYEGIRHRQEITATDLGELNVKGRAEPVHVFAIQPRA